MGKMASKAQWAYLHHRFGHRGFVKRWSKKAVYHALPARKGVKRRSKRRR